MSDLRAVPDGESWTVADPEDLIREVGPSSGLTMWLPAGQLADVAVRAREVDTGELTAPKSSERDAMGGMLHSFAVPPGRYTVEVWQRPGQ